MGTSCAPVLANMFCFAFESVFVRKEENRKRMRKFQTIARYLDDVIAIGEQSEFQEILKEIFPSYLKMKNCAEDPHSFPYLDMRILIHKTEINTKLLQLTRDLNLVLI